MNLKKLNDSQKAAVEAVDTPVLIFAGAGSGKTRVLTYKISYLIKENIVKPEEILAVISKDELRILYEFPDNPKTFEILSRLAKAWGQKHIMVFKLIENDIIEYVNYFGTWAYLFDSSKNQITKSAYSDGFAEDKRHIRYQKFIFIVIALFVCIMLPLLYSALYPMLFKSNKRPVFIYTSLFSFISTFIVFSNIN